MATPFIFTDGFDVYGPAGTTPVMTTQWTSTTGNVPIIVAGLSSPGYAARMQNNGAMFKNFGASYTRIVASIRFNCNLAGLTAISFMNSASNAFTFTFETSGIINLRTGSGTGAIIAGGGAILASSTHVLTFDITIGASGAYTVNLDGLPLYSGTGNTANSQASINTISPNISTSSNQTLNLDDLMLLDPAQAGYNSAVLTANAVIETQWVSSDDQTQFTNDGNILPLNGFPGIARINDPAVNTANSLYLARVTAPSNCNLISLALVPSSASATAKYKGVLYADSAGVPGALVATGTEVVGATAGVPIVMPFAAPQALVSGTSYWIGYINDTAVNMHTYDGSTGLFVFRRKANTYTSGAPSPAGTGFVADEDMHMWGVATGSDANFASLKLIPPPATAQSQIHSSTVGQEDLFNFPALVTNPSTIFGTAVKGFVSKSDAGARTVSFNNKSGATDVTGSAPGQALATTSLWQGSYFDVDPATGVAWTLSGANAAKAGVSVAS